LPFNPQYKPAPPEDWWKLPAPSSQVSNRVPDHSPLTGFNPQLAQPPLSLPNIGGLSPHVRRFLMAVAAVVVLLVLATVAFTPAGMDVFWGRVAKNLGWLLGSQEGNRAAAFTLFTLAVGGMIAVARHSIIRKHGSAVFGWIELTLGVALAAFALGGWYVGHIGWMVAPFMLWGAYILIVWGWENVKNYQPPAPAPQFPEHAPTPDAYGDARWATPLEVHQTWGGRQSNSDEETVFD